MDSFRACLSLNLKHVLYLEQDRYCGIYSMWNEPTINQSVDFLSLSYTSLVIFCQSKNKTKNLQRVITDSFRKLWKSDFANRELSKHGPHSLLHDIARSKTSKLKTPNFQKKTVYLNKAK
ncbi:hypothetical protein PHYBLDRAFT_168500 [Phycomyces blakesleeanus NRRL 1555(-)]|uniref:Uncharacterized protein n=1 Tax=Phycomyces blakesleeanus (strain ATCC 8743b / DSM 1359 / FGSC 10004 / NBRC 33097 / NRRL 1555) TaxID=763407 RepID=A0A162PIE7_PHYB8|nr:hypothetical protein PHYBLDRAFT_168500 [Phycomyces blakesleeanus NRRL 1555(-)]OAD73147.1 hypothetical protein PHYBLDRAFT_168500 [Phycomyces blakesleeanus NRRL 1555(-)]|eukprot:XP_018291187.1 hypothetical protein PHYBLDRAFT_168500 [Phycomyces blakesleeanus NRRL 1555(-)]